MRTLARLFATTSQILALTLLVAGVGRDAAAQQVVHGGQIKKTCVGPKRCVNVGRGTIPLCPNQRAGALCTSATTCPSTTVCIGGTNDGQLCASAATCPSSRGARGVVALGCASAVCIGGIDNGAGCSSVLDCRGATACSPCAPVPVAATGDNLLCSVVVSDLDTSTAPSSAGDPLEIDGIVDLVRHPGICPSPLSGTPPTCLTGNLLPGVGFCRPSASPSAADYVPCFATGNAPAVVPANNMCPSPTLGCSIGSACVGGSQDGKPCTTQAECPSGTCDLSPRCAGGTRNGLACASQADCNPSGGSAGQCAVVLHVGPNGTPGVPVARDATDAVTVSHTDVVQASDTNPLTDLGQATGEDNGTGQGIDLTFPASVCVVPTTSSTTTTTLPPAGCRITGGGTVNGVLNPTIPASITKAQFSGQVGAPCGCFGCFDKFDPKLASVQGNWNHQRKNKGGSMKATSFNSLVCSCLGGTVGDLCPAAEHPATMADHICITGIGEFAPDSGKPVPVAFRYEATDHGEPGRSDFYEMHIFTPSSGQTVEQLAQAICCTQPISALPTKGLVANDSGLLIAGNIQIHRALKKSTDGLCPPPRGMCVPVP